MSMIRTIATATILLAAACARPTTTPQPMNDAGRAALADPAAFDALAEGPVVQVSDAAAPGDPVQPDYSAAIAPGYRLGPGDKILVVYRFGSSATEGAYLVQAGDLLKLSFLETPNYNQSIRVGPDGAVNLMNAGELKVSGKTVADIQRALTTAYGRTLTEPTIGVQLEEAHTPAEELRAAMSSTDEGQSRTILIRPDGYISLPILGELQAAGLTIPELENNIKAAYEAKAIRSLETTVVLSEAGSAVAYVMGEVPRQGAVQLRTAMDAWRVIAQAGGFGAQADRRRVVIAKSDASGEKRYVVNFEKWRQQSDSKENILIRPGDMIYVPRTTTQFAYLSGELTQPGRVVIDEDTVMSVSQAVAMAGGVNTRGTRKQVLLLRPQRAGEPVILSIDLDALFDPKQYVGGGDFQGRPWDPLLQPGDIVHAPSTFVGDLNRFAQQWFRDGAWTIIPFSASASYTYSKGSFDNSTTQ